MIFPKKVIISCNFNTFDSLYNNEVTEQYEGNPVARNETFLHIQSDVRCPYYIGVDLVNCLMINM